MAEVKPITDVAIIDDRIILKWVKYFFTVYTLFGLILVLIGAIYIGKTEILSRTYKECVAGANKETDVVIDYTNCIDRTTLDGDEKTCREKNSGYCKCFTPFNLTEDLVGDVILYYELDSFNQSSVATASQFFQSRDDGQLGGNLTANVSSACGPHDYYNGKPIAPCGAIADALFNDVIELKRRTYQGFNVPKISSGLIDDDDKVGFRNPPLTTDLSLAFQNFSKPNSWSKNIWELDTLDANNNGFQNDFFIGWMKTDWKRKPMWKLDRTVDYFKNGLPKGAYILEVVYNYPTSVYNGTRKAILSGPYKKCQNVTTTYSKHVPGALDFGILSLITGIFFLAPALLFLYNFVKSKKKSRENI